MSEEQEPGGYGVVIFRPGTPGGAKKRGVVFFVILCVIVMVQSCYWLFANQIEPVIWGMPFGLFFIVLFIFIEFLVLLILYLLESKELQEGGSG